MTAIGRAFLAVVPPTEVLAVLEERIGAGRAVEPALRWVASEQLHLTLQFLGRVPDVEALVDATAAAVASVPAFAVQLGGAGAFPHARRAGVVWVGVVEGGDELVALADRVTGATAALGFDREERGLYPHVTVARVPKRKAVDGLLAALGDDPVGPPFDVREVVLVASETRRAGAVYTPRATFPLAGPAGPVLVIEHPFD